MTRTLSIGLLLASGGIAGYLVGVAIPYPGRSISLTVVMVGITIAAVGVGEV